jgi:hypothetical protein
MHFLEDRVSLSLTGIGSVPEDALFVAVAWLLALVGDTSVPLDHAVLKVLLGAPFGDVRRCEVSFALVSH